MKQTALATAESAWPSGVPFFEAPPEPRRQTAPRQVSVAPIELRIGGGDGPSAIAILE